MDFMELEREKGITIQSAATNCSWNGHAINIIDTPGHVDFTIEVERALRVLDGAILVLCSVAGVQSQSITVSRQMGRYNVPRIAFVNKCDRAGASPAKVIAGLREKLKYNAAAVQLPIGLETEHRGVVDLLERQALIFEGDNGEVMTRGPVPPDMADACEAARAELVERVAEVDEQLAELFLEGEPIQAADLRAAIRRATLALTFVPVMMGSAYKNKGVHALLDGVIDYLPNPAEVKNFALDLNQGEASVELKCDSSLPLCGLAFKLEEGKYGQLTYLRIYQVRAWRGASVRRLPRASAFSHLRAACAARWPAADLTRWRRRPPGSLATTQDGCADCLSDSGWERLAQLTRSRIPPARRRTLRATPPAQGSLKRGDSLLNVSDGKRVKVPRLVQMHANEMSDVPEGKAGDIVAMFGVECRSGTTFTDGKTRLSLSSMYVPDPVISLALKTKNREASANFSKALARFVKEDPTFRVSTNEETSETIIAGMGELHLEIYVERMRREYGVDCEVGQPAVAFRETLRAKAPFDYLHKKQSGGSGQYGRVVGYVEPLEEGAKETFVFDNHMVGNNIPPEFLPAVERGFVEALGKGALTGHPVVGVRVVLTDGAAHAVDSNELAFKLAAQGAFKQSFGQGRPAVLEPMMKVEVEAPVEFQVRCAARHGGARSRGGLEGARCRAALLRALSWRGRARASHTRRHSRAPPAAALTWHRCRHRRCALDAGHDCRSAQPAQRQRRKRRHARNVGRDRGRGAARQHVRLQYGPALRDAGQGRVLDGVLEACADLKGEAGCDGSRVRKAIRRQEKVNESARFTI